MNIHSVRPLEQDEQDEHLAPPEWTMAVEKNESGYYCAAVARDGQPMCRLSLNHHFESKEEAERALASRVRAWIIDFIGRTISRKAATNEERKRVDGADPGAGQ